MIKKYLMLYIFGFIIAFFAFLIEETFFAIIVVELIFLLIILKTIITKLNKKK